MANEISIYEPRYLAEVVRTTPLVRTFFLDNYFTNVKTFATKSCLLYTSPSPRDRG